VRVGTTEDYLKRMRERYREAATKREKGRLLTELCSVLACHRKSAIRLLNRPPTTPKRKPGRPRVYESPAITALKVAWEASDESCGKRLAPQLPSLFDALTRHGELALDDPLRAQVEQMSAATIDRRLAPSRLLLARRPTSHSQALSAIQRQVPIRTFGDWAEAPPGQVQADLVAHCGVNAAGAFVVTLTVVDVATGWTECRAALTKLKDRVTGAMHVARTNLPFRLASVHTDNGGEFINDALFGYCSREGIGFTRGRAYKKNDQAWVEQKNGAVVRRYVGYYRYQSPAARDRLNELYEWVRLYTNFFQPVRKVMKKERVGAKVHKEYDEARTPYQRLKASGVLDEETAKRLEQKYQALNPVRLRARITEAVRAVVATAEPRYGELSAQLSGAEDGAAAGGVRRAGGSSSPAHESGGR
jgi:hypothetical protein